MPTGVPSRNGFLRTLNRIDELLPWNVAPNLPRLRLRRARLSGTGVPGDLQSCVAPNYAATGQR